MNLGGAVKINKLGLLVLLGLAFVSVLYTYAGWKSNDKIEVNLKELLIDGIYATALGGDVVKSMMQEAISNTMSKGKTKEGADDVVTNADYRSHCVMVSHLKRVYPNLKVISEEEPRIGLCDELSLYQDKLFSMIANTVLNKDIKDIIVPISDVTVWIDPLDATQEYTEHLTEYVTTMMCVVVKGKPVIGIIHQPFLQTPLTSWAWVNSVHSDDLETEENGNLTADLKKPKIIISRSHAGPVKKKILEVFPKAEVIAAGGAGFKILEVIKGKASAYVHSTNIKKWDICAGDAILEALSGRLSTLTGQQIDYSIGTSSVVEDGILATMEHYDEYAETFSSLKEQ